MKNLMFMLVVVLLASCGYGDYRTHSLKYHGSEFVTDRVGAATSTLVSMGYQIESVDSKMVQTKVQRTHSSTDWRAVEFQVWFKVFVDPARIKAYCTQRKLYTAPGRAAPWKFVKCTSPMIIQEIDLEVSAMKNRLESGF